MSNRYGKKYTTGLLGDCCAEVQQDILEGAIYHGMNGVMNELAKKYGEDDDSFCHHLVRHPKIIRIIKREADKRHRAIMRQGGSRKTVTLTVAWFNALKRYGGALDQYGNHILILADAFTGKPPKPMQRIEAEVRRDAGRYYTYKAKILKGAR